MHFKRVMPPKLLVPVKIKNRKKLHGFILIFKNIIFLANAYDNDEEELNAYSQFNNIVFCSKSVQNAFDKTLKNNFKNKEVIYPLIHSAFCNECAQQHQQQMQDSYFLVLSRYSPQKGLDRLIKAARLLKDCNMLFKIIIIGKGELEHDLKEMIMMYNLIDEVHLGSCGSKSFSIL